jgi:hypothetical protein
MGKIWAKMNEEEKRGSGMKEKVKGGPSKETLIVETPYPLEIKN